MAINSRHQLGYSNTAVLACQGAELVFHNRPSAASASLGWLLEIRLTDGFSFRLDTDLHVQQSAMDVTL